ncbi:MAG: hypothetical protein R3299_00165 [Arenibacter sp.]|nr:hypothetical protein [Arenibacter sp.]
MKVAIHHRIILFLLLLGLGSAVMAAPPMDLNETPDYGVEKNNQQLYGDLPLSVSLVLQESNSELPAPSKSNYTLLSRQEKNYTSLAGRKPVLPLRKKTDITVGLDSLTLIYPFHTFF